MRARRNAPRLRLLAAAIVTLAGVATGAAHAQLLHETCETAIALESFPSVHHADLAQAASTSSPAVSFCLPGRSAWYSYDDGPGVLRFHPLGRSIASFTMFRNGCEALEPASCWAFVFDPGEPAEVRVCGSESYRFRFAPLAHLPFPPGLVEFRVERDAGPPDLDRDGLDDCVERCPDVFNPGEEDTDEDGVPDACDNCPSDPNPDQVDEDLDSAGDACDACPGSRKWDPGFCGCSEPEVHGDEDGLPNCVDNCPRVANADQSDRDGDGAGDACDPCPDDPAKIDPGVCGCNVADEDRDGDGIESCLDGCPDDPEKPRPGFCGCGAPELDPDGDGVASCVDNCPDTPNADQEDLDRDGHGDRCACAEGGCVVGDAPLDCGAQLVPPVTPSADGVVRCTDGEACDRDPAAGRCRIPVALCFGAPLPGGASCPATAPARIEASTSDGPSLDVLLALSSLPGARALDRRTIDVDPWPSDVAPCTLPFELETAVGEIRLNVSTRDTEGRAIDDDRFRVRCERGDP